MTSLESHMASSFFHSPNLETGRLFHPISTSSQAPRPIDSMFSRSLDANTSFLFSLKFIKCLFISPQNSNTLFPLHYHLMTLFLLCREYKNNEKSFPRTITDTYQYIFFCGCTVFILPVIKNIEIVIIANVNSSYSLELIVT